MPDQIEYLKLWMEQSKLYWSRLQTSAAIETGILLAWWQIKDAKEHAWLNIPLLILGSVLHCCILAILERDGAYVDVLREYSNRAFPVTKRAEGCGRTCAQMMIWILIIGNIYLLFMPFLMSRI